MRSRIFLLVFLLGIASLAFGQGTIVPPQTAFKVVNGITSPIANATITVCAAQTAGVPCSPVLANALFQDAALTEPLDNPFTADATGNYQFAIAAGTYTVTVSASGFSGYSYQITVGGGGGSSGGGSTGPGTGPVFETIPNCPNGATVTNGPVQLDAQLINGVQTACVIPTPIGSTSAIGICNSGCGTTGNASIAYQGFQSCVFTGQTVIGDVAATSTTAANQCDDVGASRIPGVQSLGRISSVNTGAGTLATVNLFTGDVVGAGAAGSNGTVNNGPQAAMPTYVNPGSSNQIGPDSNCTLSSGNIAGCNSISVGQVGVNGAIGFGAGTPPTLNANLSYVIGPNSISSPLAFQLLNTLPVNNDCPEFSSSGSIYSLIDSGFPCTDSPVISVTAFGAKGDGQVASDCSITASTTTLSCSSSHFQASDVGKTIVIWQAGTVSGSFVEPLSTTIAGFTNGTTVTLTAAAGSAPVNPSPHVAWGTDNTNQVANALAFSLCAKTSAADLSGCVLYFPRGYYLLKNVDINCGAIGTFGPFTCTHMFQNIAIVGDSQYTSTIESWDGNLSTTACGAYTFHCGVVMGGGWSTNDGANEDIAHAVKGFVMHDIGVVMPPYTTGTGFLQPVNIHLHGFFNIDIHNVFAEGGSYGCIAGGMVGMVNEQVRVHQNYLRFCGWGGPANVGSQAALNSVVPWAQEYDNIVYYSGQCIEDGAPHARITGNYCEAKDDITGAAMSLGSVSPQECLNIDSATYGFWDMTVSNNICSDYVQAGGVSNGIGVMSNITIANNTFYNTGVFSLSFGGEGATTGWPGGNETPPQVHGTSVFSNNTFTTDENYNNAGGSYPGVQLTGGREKWVVTNTTVKMTAASGTDAALSLGGDVPAWQPSVGYQFQTVNPSFVQPPIPNGFFYVEQVGSCTSGTSIPAFPTTIGNTVTDNTCTWKNGGAIPVQQIQNFAVALPVGDTNTNSILDNFGVLPNHFIINDFSVSGGVCGTISGGCYNTNGWSLTGFPAGSTFGSWPPTSQAIIPEGMSYSSMNTTAARNTNSTIDTGYYRLGQKVTRVLQTNNNIPSPGVSPGWLVTRSGFLGTSWQASHSYPYNALSQASPDNGHLFVTLGACTSNGSQPTWNTTSGATTTDNTCTWKEAGSDAAFVGLPGTSQQTDSSLSSSGTFGWGDNVTAGYNGSYVAMSDTPCEAAGAATTLSTGATTTDTGQNCLPANAIVDAVAYRITTTITTATSFTIGDATTAARFCSTQSTLTAGTTGVCFAQAGTTGVQQASAAKVRVTTNVNPGAGAIRLIVYYHLFVAPMS